MSNIKRISLTLGVVLFVGIATVGQGLAQKEEVNQASVPVLQQEKQHASATQRITSLFTRSHYQKVLLEDEFSNKIFKRFLKTLDFNKSILTQADIDSFSGSQDLFDDVLKSGKLTPVYNIYQQTVEKRISRYKGALTLLESKPDFSVVDDRYYYNRKDAVWATDEKELDELWRQRVKYDALNLSLTGKSWDESKTLLIKRYERNITRLTETKSEDVYQAFMNAFARSIEAHTSYLSPRNAERFKMEMNLSFEGIGAVLQAVDDYTVIRSVVPGGPAELSKQIKPQDKIIGVAQDDEEFVDIVGWRLDEVVELIKGPKGTVVILQVLKGSEDGGEPKQVRLVRDKIRLEDRAAKSDVFTSDEKGFSNKKVGVITIPSFYNNLHKDVKKEIASLAEEGIDAMIVDLRGNGGGSLTEATLLSGLFFDKGPVVQIREGNGRVTVNKDTDGVVYYAGPLTVLVDRYSASASEIFAAAIQDYGRGIVVGEQTFGKGTVQQHRGLKKIYDVYDNDLGSVQFTIAKFYRINGGSTQHKGVIPDILFPSAVDAAEWGESQEENALPYDQIKKADYKLLGSVSSSIEGLTSNYQSRIKTHPEFVYLRDDIAEYLESKDDNFISLSMIERKTEKEANKIKKLRRANERLTRLGLDAVESLDDLPEVLEEIDPLLEQAAFITMDALVMDFAKQ